MGQPGEGKRATQAQGNFKSPAMFQQANLLTPGVSVYDMTGEFLFHQVLVLVIHSVV